VVIPVNVRRGTCSGLLIVSREAYLRLFTSYYRYIGRGGRRTGLSMIEGNGIVLMILIYSIQRQKQAVSISSSD